MSPKKKVTKALKVVPQEEFQQRFKYRQYGWAMCIAVQVECFQVDLCQ